MPRIGPILKLNFYGLFLGPNVKSTFATNVVKSSVTARNAQRVREMDSNIKCRGATEKI